MSSKEDQRVFLEPAGTEGCPFVSSLMATLKAALVSRVAILHTFVCREPAVLESSKPVGKSGEVDETAHRALS